MKPDAPERLVQFPSEATGTATTPSLHHSNSSPLLHPAPTIPDYELLRCIGHGSYGEVWLARTVLGEFRAVKVVYRRAFEHERPFQREFEGIQKFEPISHAHPSQLHILHVGRNDVAGYFYYVMELADDAGENPKSETRNSKEVRNPNAETRAAEKVLRNSGLGIPLDFGIRNSDLYTPHTLKLDLYRRTRLPVDECITLGLALTTALEHLHEHGLVHRDIKPSNIIFVKGVPKLADIGLVATMDKTMSFVGTSGFLPPEGPGTPQGDIYSLGKVLYEMSMGRDRQEFPALPSDLRALPEATALVEFNEILLKACEADPRRRYTSAQAMHKDLALLKRGQSVRRKRALEQSLMLATRIGLAAGVFAMGLALVVTVRNQLSRHDSSVSKSAGSVRNGATASEEVLRLYQLGRWHFGKLTEEGHRQALVYLTNAVQLDPNFAPAYETLFQIYFMTTVAGDVKQKEREVARKLMEIDDTLAASHAALSWVKHLDRDYKEAEKEIKHAIQIDTNYALAHAMYSYYLSLSGRTEEAVEQNRIAVRIEPASRMFVTHAGYPYLTAHQYDKAIAEFRNALVLDQNYRYARDWIAHVYEDIGRITEAITESEKADILSGEDLAKVKEKHDALRRAYADEGVKGYWLKRREQELPTESPEDVTCDTAAFHAHLGEKSEALDLLEKAYAEGTCTDWLLMDPCWHGLQGEPRFHTLLKTIGLEK